MKQSKNICPVCGYAKLEEPPYDEHGYPTYVICSCCGFEFGFDDSSRKYTFERYREEWIDKGFPFFTKDERPRDWNEETMRRQLQNTGLVDYAPRI